MHCSGAFSGTCQPTNHVPEMLFLCEINELKVAKVLSSILTSWRQHVPAITSGFPNLRSLQLAVFRIFNWSVTQTKATFSRCHCPSFRCRHQDKVTCGLLLGIPLQRSDVPKRMAQRGVGPVQEDQGRL